MKSTDVLTEEDFFSSLVQLTIFGGGEIFILFEGAMKIGGRGKADGIGDFREIFIFCKHFLAFADSDEIDEVPKRRSRGVAEKAAKIALIEA